MSEALLDELGGADQRPRLGFGFLPFQLGHRVRNHPRCGLHIQRFILDDAGAYGNGYIHVTGITQIPTGTAVKAPLGGLQLIGLAGEPVVDYSLKLREQHGWGRTWVAGYCDDLVNYVPTERVRDEGGYEGRTGMMEYGWPSAYAAGLESRIVGAVDEMLKKTAL